MEAPELHPMADDATPHGSGTIGSMRKACILPALLAGTVVTLGTGLGLLAQGPAFSAILDGFAINTQDKAVTVTLYTDQRTPYTTENHGKQFAIILPEAQLAPDQVSQGLPVVIDNQNRFIGRAVPTQDGRVKIILPNLPASEYAISVQQKRPTDAKNTPPAATPQTVKPRTAVQTAPQNSNRFERLATSAASRATATASSTAAPTVASAVTAAMPAAPQPTAASRASVKQPPPAPVITLSPTPASETAAHSNPSQSGTIWNPYVQATQVPSPGKTAYSQYKPVQTAAPRRAAQVHVPPPIQDMPLTSLSVADPSPARSATPANPNWYLNNALPAVDLSQIPLDNLSGLATDGIFNPTVAAITDAPPTPATMEPPTSSSPSATSDPATAPWSTLFERLPLWLSVTGSIFLGGIGLFALIGGLVLLRLLFTQVRAGQLIPVHTPMMSTPVPGAWIMQPPAPSPTPHSTSYGPTEAATAVSERPGTSAPTPLHDGAKSPYASKPATPIAFADTAAINTLDYLQGRSRQVEAAPSAVLPFPTQRSRHTHRRPSATNRSLTAQR